MTSISKNKVSVDQRIGEVERGGGEVERGGRIGGVGITPVKRLVGSSMGLDVCSPLPFPGVDGGDKENTPNAKTATPSAKVGSPARSVAGRKVKQAGPLMLSPPGKKVQVVKRRRKGASSPSKPFGVAIEIEKMLSPKSAQEATNEYRAMLRSGRKPGPVLGFRKYHYRGLNAEGNIYIGEKDL